MRDSIIMEGATIGENVVIDKAIIAEDVVIGDNVILGVGEGETEQVQTRVLYHSDLVTIGEKSVIPAKCKDW